MSNNDQPASVPNPMAAPGPSPAPAATPAAAVETKPAPTPAAASAAKPPTPQQQALQQQIQAQLQAQLQQQLQAAAAKGKQANITPEMIQVGLFIIACWFEWLLFLFLSILFWYSFFDRHKRKQWSKLLHRPKQ